MYVLLISQKLIHRVFRHVILFVSMVLLFSWVASSRPETDLPYMKVLLMVTINAVFFFGYAYLTVYFLIPALLVKKRYLAFTFLFLVAGIGLSILKLACSDFIFYQAIAPGSGLDGATSMMASLLINTKDMTFIVALFALAKFARDRYLLDTQIREIQRKGLEAELKLLEHHMDPHMIFNNFNSLYAISINKHELLVPTLNKLRSLLHYLFDESKKDKVALLREVEMIENYIGLEKLRFGERLKVSFNKEGPLDGLKIAPLILYSFVENCFVHGACADPSRSWINIELSVKDTRLTFMAANSVSERQRTNKDQRKSGSGENSLRRLELQYPNSHRVTIRERKNSHQVELNVSL
ncbi:MAG: sensor histidine kinase [Bacteroidales bacterium]